MVESDVNLPMESQRFKGVCQSRRRGLKWVFIAVVDGGGVDGGFGGVQKGSFVNGGFGLGRDLSDFSGWECEF